MDKQINGFFYVRVEKGIYELVEAGIIEHTALKEHRLPFVFEHASMTPRLWRHNKNIITFTLVVKKIGIKYKRKEVVMHFIHALHEKYEITQDCNGSIYNDITLKWDYEAGLLEISMSVYVKEAIHNFSTPLQADTRTPHTNRTPLTMAPQHHSWHTKPLNHQI